MSPLFSPLFLSHFLLSKSPTSPSLPYSTHLTAQPFLSAPFSFCISVLCSPFSSSSLPQVAALQEEKSSLLAENQVLMERLNQSDSIEDINSPAGRRHLQLQTQLEQLQEETFRYRAAKERGILSCKQLKFNWLMLMSKMINVAESSLGWKHQKMTTGSVVKSLKKNSWMWSRRMKSSRHLQMKPSLSKMRWMSSGRMGTGDMISWAKETKQWTRKEIQIMFLEISSGLRES